MLTAAGCATLPGEGFGTVTDAALAVRWQGQGRAPADAPGTWLSAGYRFALDAEGLAVRTGQMVLEGTTGAAAAGANPAGAAGAAFDPARPPAGFTLCHNGHCHATDGRLVAYEQVPMEAARAAGTLVTVSFADLLPQGARSGVGPGVPESRQALSCGRCAMPEGQLVSVALPISGMTLSGTVTSRDPGSPLVGGTRRFALDLQDVDLTLRDTVAMSLRWTRPERIGVEAVLVLPESLLDALPWQASAAGLPAGTLRPVAEPAFREALLTAMAKSRLDVRLLSPTP